MITNRATHLTAVHPSVLAPGLGGVGRAVTATTTPTSTTAPATVGDARPASAWLDEGAQGRLEVLHVGPNSRPRDIEAIVRDFKQALCQQGPDTAR